MRHLDKYSISSRIFFDGRTIFLLTWNSLSTDDIPNFSNNGSVLNLMEKNIEFIGIGLKFEWMTTCCKLVVSFGHGRMVWDVQHAHVPLSTIFEWKYEFCVFRQRSSKKFGNDYVHCRNNRDNQLTNEYGEFKYSSVASNSTGLGLYLLWMRLYSPERTDGRTRTVTMRGGEVTTRTGDTKSRR